MAEMMENEHRYMDDARYTFKGVGNGALATGIIGTALGVLNGGLGLMGGYGNGLSNHASGYVTKEAWEKQNEVSALESKVALLEANAESEKKMIDVYERVQTRVLALERQVADNAASQGVINAQLMSGQSVLQSQVAQLMGLTKLVVPNTSVCPGWGNVTITPA